MAPEPRSTLRLFLCGDVMLGRGIDQVLPHSVEPTLHERYIKDARRYVALAEEANGPIPQPVDYDYIWGDALAELDQFKPNLRLINLETSVTTSDDYWRGKGINYRMHPANIPCLEAAGIECCALANNHVLDWGYPGLAETLETLRSAELVGVGSGQEIRAARAPAVFERDECTLLIFSVGLSSSGIPREWAATSSRPGVNLLAQDPDQTVARIARKVEGYRQGSSVIVASLHWGANWGYEVPSQQQALAHRLIDEAGVDVVHGHSSHHVKGIEVYRDRLVLYGCGDFLTDYEGIAGYEEFRGELGLMYFPEIDAVSGELLSLTMTPTEVRRFQVTRANREAATWLQETLNREGRRFNTRIQRDDEGRLHVQWH